MNAEILAVGTEILLGDLVNTNAEYIARGLAELGVGVYYQTVVGDNPERMKKAMDIAFDLSLIHILYNPFSTYNSFRCNGHRSIIL